MRVSVDCTSLLHEPTGIGVFTRELVSGLARRGDVDLSVFAVTWRGRDRLGLVAPTGATVRARAVPARLARECWKHLDVPTARHLAGRTDVVHGPNFVVPPGGGAAEVLTIHDLTALHFPEMCTPDVLQWPDLARRAMRRGAWVHTVSEFVADEVRDAFPEAGDRVVAVPNGVSEPPPSDASSDAAAGHHLAGGQRYVLAMGTVDPRKDLPSLVRAFDLLAAQDPDLVLVLAGADGLGTPALDDAMAASPNRSRIVRLGWIDDAKRLALLRGATVVAYPSRYEGFGLVPLEAMAVGTPVVATRVGAIPEVVGDGALLVPERDPDALATALGQILSDDTFAEAVADDAFDRVALFPWSATVDGLVDIYRRAAG